MKNLIKELKAPHRKAMVIFVDAKGKELESAQTMRPPTALDLRAAAALEQMLGLAESANSHRMRLQVENLKLTDELVRLRAYVAIKDYYANYCLSN